VSAQTTTPRWTLVDARCRCARCGKLVERAWRCFTTPTTSTWDLCEPCVAEMLEDEQEAS